jgi:hypothetical protein
MTSKEDPPLVSLKVTNPVTYIKIWWKKIIGNEGISFAFKVKPLTAIVLTMVVMAGLTGTGFSIAWLTFPETSPIVKYIPQLVATPTPNPWKETAFTGNLKYTEATKRYFLVTTSSEAITLQVPDNIDLSKFVGKRIMASGNYNKSIRTLVVADAQDMEVLPTKAVTIPTNIPTPTTSIPPAQSLTPSAIQDPL